MTKKISKYFIFQMLQLSIINEDDYEIYLFGLESFLTFLSHLVLIFLSSIFLNNFVQTLIFITVFFFLRGLTGGIHMKSEILCFFSSFFLVYSLLFIKNITLGFPAKICILSFCTLIHFSLAPVDNKLRVLDEKEKKYFKKKLSFFLSIIVFLDLLLFIFHFTNYSNLLSFIVIINTFSIIIGSHYRNRRSSIFL